MKKTLFAFSAIAVLLGFTACTSENENIEPQAKGKKVIIYANTEEPTRATLGEGDETNGYPVVWEAGDAFSVFVEEYGETFAFTLKSGEGTTKGTFECEEFYGEGTFNAYYGYDGTNWPTAQPYREGNITGMPMVAENVNIDWGGNLPTQVFFKNVGGILRLNLKGTAKIKYIQVKATELDSPVLLYCGDGITLSESTAIPFHIALPANDYTNLKFIFYNEDEFVTSMSLKADKTLKVERSKITNVNLTLTKEFSTPEETITASSPVGTIGMLDGRQGIVVELNGTKVVIATKNIGATSIIGGASSYGDYMSWSDACTASENETWGKGWYLPSKDEISALVENLLWNPTNKWCTWDVTEIATLFFPAAAWYDSDGGPYTPGTGSYWSKTEKDANYAYSLSFGMNSGTPICGSGYRPRYFSVRPFHAMPTE